MRRATRRQGRTVRQSEGHDGEGMRREERQQAGKVSELEEQSRTTRVGNERRRGDESRQHNGASESSGHGGDRPRRRERQRNGDWQTLNTLYRRDLREEVVQGRQMAKDREGSFGGVRETKRHHQQQTRWTQRDLQR